MLYTRSKKSGNFLNFLMEFSSATTSDTINDSNIEAEIEIDQSREKNTRRSKDEKFKSNAFVVKLYELMNSCPQEIGGICIHLFFTAII